MMARNENQLNYVVLLYHLMDHLLSSLYLPFNLFLIILCEQDGCVSE